MRGKGKASPQNNKLFSKFFRMMPALGSITGTGTGMITAGAWQDEKHE